ncbi:SpoIIE family protein phosphatase [Umezawaea sp. Da 62-37]|uniref:SpoIIE family protein phosphatase n=1 Tax=Umezawaea sp. Da 62-37 TaxID=3075927 RepID=UPI0028F6F0F9|nr:SpoIIE family protein phosphatase [Umezawaea sp. Da 62-37]WNV88716.1 SpoIIE family protein phosphatase [Umezawaea sp. Da 62-37]
MSAAEEGGAADVANLTRLAATVERLSLEVRRARAAADGRALVELARGVLVERLECGPAQAALQLTALAERSGTPELELAAEIINQAAHDRLAATVKELLGTPEAGSGSSAAAHSPGVRLRTAESGALAASDTQAVAESLLEHALAPLGAAAAAIWSVGNDSSLSLAGAAGFAVEDAGRWHYVPPGVATPARQALVARDAVWIDDLAASGLPSIGSKGYPGGRVAVPAGTGGRILGVLEICWPLPIGPQSPQIRRQVDALAELCAHTLDATTATVWEPVTSVSPISASLPELVELADGLLDAAMVLLPHQDATGSLVDFRIHHVNGNFADLAGRPRSAMRGALLLEVYPLAADDGGVFDKIERTYATGEAYRAPRMALAALIDQVPLTVIMNVAITRHGDSVLVVWRIQDDATRLANMLQHAQRLGSIGGFEEDRATDQVTWSRQLFTLYGMDPSAAPIPLTRLPEYTHVDDATAIERFLRTVLRHLRPASTAFRLQRPDGVVRHIRVIAEPVLDSADRLLAVRGAYQDVSSQHWTEVALSATRDQLAHSEQRTAEQNRLALQLQQAIMPPAQPTVELSGLRIAVRYRPAELEHLVGGDWYDVVLLPSKQVLVSVGDITGHGIQGATGMVVLRNALRGLAATGANPSQLVAWLNLVAHHLTDNIFATAICGLYDPETRVLRWARAGHPAPVLVRAGQATALPMLGGVLLGALSAFTYEESEVQLQPDDVLLFYTDGLIERRDRDLDECVDWLLATSTGSTAASLDERLDGLLEHSESDTEDDTCVVGIQVI